MPKFEQVPLREATASTATGKRARIIREYQSYLEQLTPGNAGKLVAGEGESVAAVRRRLGAAAKAAGVELIVRRSANAIYFWPQETAPRRRRGRPRKTPTTGA